MGIHEIAVLTGVKRHTVNMWRFRGLLPEPDRFMSGIPIWDWPIVEQWAKDTGRL